MTDDLHFAHRAFAELTLLELHDLLRLREEVFVVGQGITVEAEIDGRDPEAVHVWARDGEGTMVAAARLLPHGDDVKVGRVAVMPARQRGGVGTALMAYVHGLLGARRGVMSAQAHLRDWYERLGWSAQGEGYDEAGIPHVRMVREAREAPENARAKR
jgi:ElaA protein